METRTLEYRSAPIPNKTRTNLTRTDQTRTKIYVYTIEIPRKDGTIGIYTQRIPRTIKRERKLFTQEDISIIQNKLDSGVSKKRICQDYDISFPKLQKLIVK